MDVTRHCTVQSMLGQGTPAEGKPDDDVVANRQNAASDDPAHGRGVRLCGFMAKAPKRGLHWHSVCSLTLGFRPAHDVAGSNQAKRSKP